MHGNQRAWGTTFELSVTLPSGRVVPVAAARKSGISRITIRVHANRSVSVSIPLRAGTAGVRQAELLLERKAGWIQRKLEERRDFVDWRHPEQLVRIIDGATPLSGTAILPLWGKPVDARKTLSLDSSLDPESPRNAEELARRIKELYRRELERRLPNVASRAEREMGLAAKRWSVRDMVSRWGSCTPERATIRIALQLAAYPPELLDLIVRHELAHLAEQNHGPRFHALLEQAYPGHRAAQALLRLSPLEAAEGLEALRNS